MHPGSDALGAPSSFTARRSAASNLPNFELPPPPLAQLNHKFQPFAAIPATQPAPVSSSVTSVGNLLTPPSTLQGDGMSPLSSGVTSGSSASGQAIPPYTPTGYWPQAQTGSQYGYQSGSQLQGMYPARGLFSPTSLNHIMRSNSTQSPSDQLPPPPYDLNQLPPFPSSMPISNSSPSLPALQAQQQAISSAMMNNHNAGQPSASGPSPAQMQEPFQVRPPTNSSYYPNPQTSSAPPPSAYPYGSRPSPHQGSAAPANGPLHQMSPSNASGEMPPLQTHSSHSPGQYQQRPYSYSLPAMSGGPAMSNLHSPGGQMSFVGGMSNSMISGYNSGHVSNMQHMYGVHSSHQQPPNDRPFKCDQCIQSFNRNHDLKRHKRIHLAVKPFPCGHCEKSFSRKDALKRHILVKGCGKARAAESVSQRSDGSLTPKSDPSDQSKSPPVANGLPVEE